MDRRHFLKLLTLLPAGVAGCQYWPHEGFANDCLTQPLPAPLKNHELLAATWDGIDTGQVWDCHCHLIGVGDSPSGIWVNPKMQSLLHPIQLAQFKFYLDASCTTVMNSSTVDEGVMLRLLQIHGDLPSGFRFMLLGFDHYHDETGNVDLALSPFHTPNTYAQAMATAHPQQCEWIASIHPYREDALEALDDAVQYQARAVKWLPSVMGIDAANPRCDAFYQALSKYDLPLLTHVGDEHAVDVPSGQTYNNPLLFRRALDHGVRVIFAHCATLGESTDLDKGPNGPLVHNLELFARLMAESRYEKLLLGDISAITQVNRDRWKVEKILQTVEWHERLVYGSDYPLPGVMPVFSPQNFVDWGMLPQSTADIVSEVRRYNPILFDVMLKRLIGVKGKQLKQSVFETRRHFVKSP